MPSKPVFLFAMPLLAFIAGGGASASPQAGETPVVSIAQELDPDQIKAKISEIESRTDLEESVKSKALDFYNQALNRLEQAAANQANGAGFKQQIDAGPGKVEEIRKKIEALKERAGEEAVVELPSEGTPEALDALLVKEQAALSDLKNQAADLASKLKAEQGRPAEARREKAEAEQRMEDYAAELKAPPPANQHPLVTEAHKVFMQARGQARTTQLLMLDQEMLSYEIRLALITVMQEWVSLQVSRTGARVEKIKALVAEQRRAEADRARKEAEDAEREALGKHPAIAELTRRNSELVHEWEVLVSEIEQVKAARQEMERQLGEVKTGFENSREQVKRVGLSRVLGEVLKSRQKKLREIEASEKSVAARSGRIAEVNVKQFSIQEELDKLGDLDAAIGEILDTSVEEPLSPKQLEKIWGEIGTALESRRDLLKKMDATIGELVNELTQLDVEEQLLVQEAQKYHAFLSERLLWSPSLPAVSWNTVNSLPESFAWFADPEHWMASGRTLLEECRNAPVLPALTGIVFLALMILRIRFRRAIVAISEKVGRVQVDSFGLSVKALLLTTALSAPYPLLIWSAGYLLRSAVDAPELPRAVGFGLEMVAFFLLVILFLWRLCGPKGVAPVHYRWPERSVSLLRRHLVWLMPVFVPAVFICETLERHTGERGETYDGSLGRLTFMVAMTALALFAHRLLRLKGGIAEKYVADHPERWLARLRYLWFTAAVGIPLVLIILAVMGYYHTAMSLASRLIFTIFLIVGTLIVHDLIIRGLLVAQRRLALARARQRREEAAKAAEEEVGPVEDAGEDDVVTLDVPEMDISTISGQTRKLLDIFFSFIVLVGLWLIWAQDLPALGILDKVALWHTAEVGPEGPTLVPVTLTSLLLSILVGIVTFVAAANIPGVLEILILQRLPMEAGSRYAVTTVSRYVIIAVGLVIACSILGIKWSSLQWLVAALSVGLGFGLQEIVANFVSGLIILFERPIRIGDTVTVGGVTGTVTRIRIRATTITDRDRKELIVPNKSFITGEVVNWTLSDPIARVKIPVGIAYGSDTVLAHRVLREVIQSNPLVLEEPKPRILFLGFGDNALNFEVRVFIRGTGNVMNVRNTVLNELHMAIDKAFRERKIEIAFPQRDIHIRSVQAPFRFEKPE